MTILLVEDSEDDVFFFERAWRKAGRPGTLLFLSNCREAMDYLSRQPRFANINDFPWPDIVFLDLKMPMLNGFELLKWMREQNFSKPFRIVVLSGSAQE